MIVHAILNGVSYDLEAADLDVGNLSTDQEIREAVARHAEQPISKLNLLVVDRNTETGDVTLRPNASFGSGDVATLTVSLYSLSYYAAIMFTVFGALLGLMGTWIENFWKNDTAPKLLITNMILCAASIVVAVITKFLQ